MEISYKGLSLSLTLPLRPFFSFLNTHKTMHEATSDVTVEPSNENCDTSNWDITELEEEADHLDHLENLAS